MEEWKVINDFPNYLVSNMGNVKNNTTQNIFSPNQDKDGYLTIGIYDNLKKRKYYRIHRLVAIHFLPNLNNYEEIDHINHNVNDNRLINLRWCDRSINSRGRRKFTNAVSKYKGVYWRKDRQKWIVAIFTSNNGKIIKKQYGSFDNEEEAGLAYNKYILDNGLENIYVLNDLK